MRDRADLLTDREEEKTLLAVQGLYDQALKTAVRKNHAVFERLEAVSSAVPPSIHRTQKQQDDWRKREKRRILRQSGLITLIAREIANAGAQAALLIQQSMQEIDRINREADDIG